MNTKNGCLGLVLMFVLVVLYIASGGDKTNNGRNVDKEPPALSETDMLISSEIRCDSPAIWISRHDSSKTGKAQGFFIQIKQDKGKLFVFDINSDTNGTLRLSGNVKKVIQAGQEIYTIEGHESEAQWQYKDGLLTDVIFTPQKGNYGYMITSQTSNGCSIAKTHFE
ncbi:hypothetical protein [Buttiauxella noackiae]|nr:hypothetical protein [Buttiauxella noackiae]